METEQKQYRSIAGVIADYIDDIRELQQQCEKYMKLYHDANQLNINIVKGFVSPNSLNANKIQELEDKVRNQQNELMNLHRKLDKIRDATK